MFYVAHIGDHQDVFVWYLECFLDLVHESNEIT